MDSTEDPRPSVGIRISSDPEKTEITNPGTGSPTEAARLPFRMVLIADLDPELDIEDWSAGSRVHGVDKNRFSALLAKYAPTLNLEVPNAIRSQPRFLEVSLVFRSLDDFKPKGIVSQIPALSQLSGIRDAVSEVRAGKVDAAGFRDNLKSFGIEPDWAEELHQTLFRKAKTGQQGVGHARPRTETQDTSALDRILGMVDAGGEQETAETAGGPSGPEGLMGALVSAVAGQSESGIDASAADKVIEDLNDVIARQLHAVLENDRFRNLESNWRGLKFLVDRIDFRSDNLLDVLAAPRNMLAHALHEQILLPEHDGDHEAPLSLVVLAHEFDHSPADIELLADVADTAESLQTVALASVSPGFFGLEDPTRLGSLPTIGQHLTGPEYIEWNKLTERSSAGYLAMAIPPFVLRAPYTAANSDFDLPDGRVLWGTASLAVAAVLARRVSETSWPTLITGYGERGLEDMVLSSSGQGPIPLSVAFSDHKQLELADAGFTALGCVAGKDFVYIAHAPTIAKSRRFDDDEMTALSEDVRQLQSMLFILRVAHFLLREQHTTQPPSSAEKAATNLRSRLWSFMGLSNDSKRQDYVSVAKDMEASTAGQTVLRISVRSPASILPRSTAFSAAVVIPNTDRLAE